MEFKLMGILGYKHTKGNYFSDTTPPLHPLISVIEKNDEEEKNILHRIS